MGNVHKIIKVTLGHGACPFVPLKEPIVAYGPFVINTEEEIRQAYRDYQEGKFGN
jgi:quercetin 2,3-dioxygenase